MTTDFRRRATGALVATAVSLSVLGVLPSAQAVAQEGPPLLECTTVWLGAGATDSWHEPLNWSAHAVPDHDDVACTDDYVLVTADAPVRQLRGTGVVTVEEGGELRVLEGGGVEAMEVLGGRLHLAAGSLSAGSVRQEGGAVDGPGTLIVTRELRWTGGTQAGGADGLTRVEDGAVATLDVTTGAAWGDRSLQVDGSAVLSGAGAIDFGAAGVRLADATFEVGSVDVRGNDVTVDGATVLAVTSLPPGAQLRGEWSVAPESGLLLDEAEVHGRVDLLGNAALAFGGDIDGDQPARSVLHAGAAVVGTGTVRVDVGAALHAAGEIDVETLTVSGKATVEGEAYVGALGVTGHLALPRGAYVAAETVTVESTAEGGLEVPAGAVIDADRYVELRAGGLLLGGEVRPGITQTGGTLALTGTPTLTGTEDVPGRYRSTGGTLHLVFDDGTAPHLTVDGDASLAGALVAPAAPQNEMFSAPVLTADEVRGGYGEVSAGPASCPDADVEGGQLVFTVAPCVSVGFATAAEDDGVVAVPVAIPAALEQGYAFDYQTVDGTAGAGTDFEPVTGTATIAPGETQTTVEIALVDDDAVEDDESFDLAVTGPTDAATAVGTVTVVDDDNRIGLDSFALDILGSGSLMPTGSNHNGVVGVTNASGDITGSWVFSFAERALGEITGLEGKPVNDVNAEGQILGDQLVRQRGGELRALAPVPGTVQRYGQAINDAGVVAGRGYLGSDRNVLVRWNADGTPEVLPMPETKWLDVADINEHGVIVGSFLPVDGTRMQPFRYDEDGLHVLPEPGAPMWGKVMAINDDGLAVGYSGLQGVLWAADGTVTDLGKGRALDVNDAGLVVGTAHLEDPSLPQGHDVIAAAWVGTERFDLNDHLPDARGLHVQYAEEVNNRGDIAGTAIYQAGNERTVVLRPFDCAPCVLPSFDEPSLTGQGRVPVTGATTEGNAVRLLARIDNPTTAELDVEIELLDDVTGEPLTEEPLQRTLAPGGRVTEHADIDTEGMAWRDGAPAPARPFRIVITDTATGRVLTEERTSLLVDPRPLVLVHGLWSDASTWAAYPALVRGAHPRWEAFAVDSMDTSSSVPKTVLENAAELDAYLEDVRDRTGAWSVDIVGHSMGGLISRRYVQDRMPTYFLGGDPSDERPVVRSLVMLGTPNAGTPCAWAAPVPATVELRPEVVAAFNAVVNQRRGVAFSTGVGQHLPFTCMTALPGDDVVPELSAVHGVEDAVDLPGTAHTSMTGSRSTFQAAVLPRLNGTAVASPVAGFASTAAAPAVSADLPTQPDVQALFLDELEVAGADTEGVGLTVPAGASTVAVTLTGPRSVSAQLINPAGAVVADVPAEGAASAVGFRTLSAPAEPGRWVLRLRNPQSTGATVGVAAGALGLPVTLSATAEQVHWSGRIGLTARYDAPAGTTAPVNLVGVLRHAGGTAEVQVHDDGQHGDGAAGDGRYAGLVPAVDEGPAVATFSLNRPGRMLATSAAVVVDIPDVPPANTVPTALAAHVDAIGDGQTRVTLQGTDADGDDLTYEVVDGPDHGRLLGSGPSRAYEPQAGYRGPDSFTFTVSDGRDTSAPATITLEVGAAIPDVRYLGPVPAQAAQGQSVLLSAVVLDGRGAPVPGVEVTFDLDGIGGTSTTGQGGIANVAVVVDLTPGPRELTITTAATADLRAGRQVKSFEVIANRPPAPGFGGVSGDEAGYPVRYDVGVNDPDGDAVRAEWDFDADGTVDATTLVDGLGRTTVTHVHAAAYTGPVAVTVVDSLGGRGTAVRPVVIGPSRPLGSLRRLTTPDGAALDALEIDRSGRYVLAVTAIPGSANPVREQLVVLDRTTGAVEVASRRADGSVAESVAGRLSPDGRHVAFRAAPAGGGRAQVYLRDLDAGTTTLVSARDGAPGAEGSTPLGVAADGAAVLFSSDAGNLGGPACGGCVLLHRWTRSSGGLTVASIGLDGEAVPADALHGSLSGDGEVVAFVTDVPGPDQVLVRDLRDGRTSLVSVDRDGGPGDGDSSVPVLDDDGSTVAFVSAAGDLTDEDGTYRRDVFVRDLVKGTTRSLTSAAGPADADSSAASISGDGRHVAFTTAASTVVEGDTNGASDVFVSDLSTGLTRRVSQDPRDGEQGNGPSLVPGSARWLSCHGAAVVFRSEASNLVPGDVFTVDDSFADGPAAERCGVPTAVVTGPASTPEGTPVELDAGASSAPDGPVTGFTWDLDGDGAFDDAAGASVTVPAADDGVLAARVQVTSAGGGAAEAAHEVTVTNVVPTVAVQSGGTVAVEAPWRATASFADPGADTWSATVDRGDGAGPQPAAIEDGTVVVTGSWASPGPRTVVVRVCDDDGGCGTATTTVTVAPAPTRWPWSGFFAPVDNAPAVNTRQAGQAVPLTFSLGGYRGMDVLASGSPSSQAHACGSTTTTGPVEPAVNPGASQLTYAKGADRYQYVWKTQKSWAGQCRTLTLTLKDGSVHTAQFRFR